MNGHPGGDAHTMRMIELCALSPGARVLDMGAGEGEAVALLRAQGLDAVGIDLIPCGENVVRGDMLHSGYPVRQWDHDLGPDEAKVRLRAVDTVSRPAASISTLEEVTVRAGRPGAG